MRLRLAAAQANRLVHLFLQVADSSPVQGAGGNAASAGDSVRIWLRSARGIQSWTISPEAPGPFRIRSSGQESAALEGHWVTSEDDSGYALELTFPLVVGSESPNVELAVEVADVETPGRQPVRFAGTASGRNVEAWINLRGQWPDLSQWLADSTPTARAWLVDSGAWVLADSGGEEAVASETTWLQRLLYRLVSQQRPEIELEWPESPVRLHRPQVLSALAGEPASGWSQDFESATVRNTVAVPVTIRGQVRGALVLQSRTDGLLLVTNQALGRLFLTTLALVLGIAGGLWYFASRLSRRVERLSGAVSQAMDDGVPDTRLPLTSDRDELGELARNNARLLGAVKEYNQYLQTLAGKLSHELKTPLAITRSSLDNLASLSLDEEARRFLDRAREGLDRQGEIVRAMSEASRLEQAIEVAEWETVDLGKLAQSCAEAYRAVHPGRSIEARVPEAPVEILCAPDLLAQALDKLVDNAVTLTGPNDEVVIELYEQADSVRLGVRNSGSRLPDSLQDRLFDSLVSVRKRRGEGAHLGLGLYVVRLVAEAHGGKASASNLPNNGGVAFFITIPRSQ